MPIEYFFEFLNNWLQIDFLSLFPFYFLNFTCFGTLLVRKQASIRLWAPQGRGGFLSRSSGHTHSTGPGTSRAAYAVSSCELKVYALLRSSWAHLSVHALLVPEAWAIRPESLPLCLSLHSGGSADLGGPADPLHVLEGVVAAVHASVDEG